MVCTRVGLSGHFYIIDASDKTNPTTILYHQTGLEGISVHDCAVTYDEHYLITADETSGGHIKIWDISDYDNINLVSEYMTHPDHSVHNVYIRCIRKAIFDLCYRIKGIGFNSLHGKLIWNRLIFYI